MIRHVRQFLSRNVTVNHVRLNTTEAAGAANSSPAAGTSTTPPVVKVSLIQQWKRFWKVLFMDYKEVVIDTAQDMKTRPRRAAIYVSGIGLVLYAMGSNPDAKSFYEVVVESADNMILVSDLNKNPSAEERLRLLHASYNEGIIRHTNLGIFSLMWLGNYHSNLGIYPSQCSYLKPGLADFHERIIDVGFLGRWWNITRYMKDYDISPIEFPPNK